jgi:hypothetical protein
MVLVQGHQQGLPRARLIQLTIYHRKRDKCAVHRRAHVFSYTRYLNNMVGAPANLENLETTFFRRRRPAASDD